MSTIPNGRYSAEVGALDTALSIRLSEIRAAQDRREITVREACDRRISALEQHLAAVRELRRQYFGDE